MKKLIILVLALACSFSLVSCISTTTSNSNHERYDLIPMVMVDGKMYYDTGRISSIEGRCGTMDGEITSTVESWEIPTKNNQSNFGAGFGYQYGANNTIEVYINDNWVVFEYGSGEGKIKFNNQWFDKGFLSDDTLEWLEWYNGLSDEEQRSVENIPDELLLP